MVRKPILTINAENRDAHWITYQAFKLSTKYKIPMEVHIRSGSLETSISPLVEYLPHLLDSALVAVLFGKLVDYIIRKRRQGRKIEFKGPNQDLLMLYASDYLRRRRKKIIDTLEESVDNFGNLTFVFIDRKHRRFRCSVSRNFQISYELLE
jgi:hypothetical protein